MILELLQALFLGLIQGVTELLPISSSFHVLFFQKLIGFQGIPEKEFCSIIQLGSALALFFRLFSDVQLLCHGLWRKQKEARDTLLSSSCMCRSLVWILH